MIYFAIFLFVNCSAYVRILLFESLENAEAGKILLDWGLTLEDNTVSFDARVVQAEKIVFGKNREVVVSAKADWSRDATSNTVLSAVRPYYLAL